MTYHVKKSISPFFPKIALLRIFVTKKSEIKKTNIKFSNMRRGERERESHHFAVEIGMYFNLSKPLVKGRICVLVYLCCYNKNNRLLYQQSKFMTYCSRDNEPKIKAN